MADILKTPTMKRYLLFAATAILTLCQLSAQTSTELKGTISGCAQASYSSGDATMAFDNDLSTLYASNVRSNTWVALDLGERHVITKVAYAPPKNRAERMLLGVFEGANNPDFTDAVPLYMIKTTPTEGVLTEADINVSRGFRYVRYVGPNDCRCNVAELKFYGYKGEGDDSQFYTATNLPLVVVHTDGAQAITSKTVYIPAIISVISDRGKTYYSDSLQIRGRGNAAWNFPKKPYKLKLAKKTHLLGMPAKAKKWTLINNYGDKTFMRNAVAFHISDCMGMSYTPAIRMVEVMLNGEYEGIYQLCDQIEVKKNRVNITEMTPEENSLPELTGGYLVEIDGYAAQEKSWFTSSNYDLNVTIKSPDEDEITSTQKAYVKKQFSTMTQRVANALYYHPTFGYRKYLDPESFCKYFLIEELCANTDAFWSTYMYKDRDSTRFRTGPIWDMDLSLNNDIRCHPITSMTEFLYSTNNCASVGDMRGFVTRIINNEKDLLTQLWSRARYDRGLDMESLNTYIDSLQTLIDEAQEINFIRWPILNQIVNQNFQITGSYENEIQVIRDFLEYRLAWMDEKIGLTPVGIEDNIMAEGYINDAEGGISAGGFSTATEITVYDISGMEIATANASTGTTFISLAPGIYIVKATNSTGTLKKKIIVR